MAASINIITVVLEKDTREDDCEHIMHAIRMIKGVMAVKANEADHVAFMAEARARRTLEQKLWDALRDTK